MDKEPNQYSKQYFQYGNKVVEYMLIQSKRRKTTEIIVERGGITIRAPSDKTLKDIDSIFHEKIKWITTKQKEFQHKEQEIIKPTYENKSTLPFLGINYQLDIIPNRLNHEERFVLENNTFIANVNVEDKTQSDKIKHVYKNWLISKANEIFYKKVKEFSQIVNVQPKRVIVKDLVNRWGSVTKHGIINLNVNLVKAPEDVIDYIIIHELCHLEIKGHSFQFWKYLRQYVPDYEQRIEWLSRNSNNLL